MRLLTILLLLPLGAAAQTTPQTAEPGAMPKGPAEVIGGAQKARRAREMQQAIKAGEAGANAEPDAPAEPEAAAERQQEEPPVEGEPSPGPADPHAQNPHAATAGRSQRALTDARIDTSLKTGTVRVRVVDVRDAPVHDAEVVLGIMKPDRSHSELTAKTDADGVAIFADLDASERQAYRANVEYQGARFSSAPFRLPPSGGYDVMLRRLPVTRDDRNVVLYVGATSLELKDERLKVVQQARLYNIGAEAYAFPEEGLLVRLPDGFMAVQSEESMTDQRIEEASEGVRIHGSLLPGEETLLWGFDLPLSNEEMSFEIEVPWTTFAYRIVADAPAAQQFVVSESSDGSPLDRFLVERGAAMTRSAARDLIDRHDVCVDGRKVGASEKLSAGQKVDFAAGLKLSANGFPCPRLHDDAGRRFWVTEMQRRVGDPPFESLKVSVQGIPGPGPWRWVAVLLSVCAIAVGLVIAARQRPRSKSEQAAALEARRQEVLERARALQAQRDAGEIGPEYFESQRDALREELSLLLLEEDRARAAVPTRGGTHA